MSGTPHRLSDIIERVSLSITPAVHVSHPHITNYYVIEHQIHSLIGLYYTTRSHPEMVGDMSRVTLNFDLSKIPFEHF